jgi:hypothetical protein
VQKSAPRQQPAFVHFILPHGGAFALTIAIIMSQKVARKKLSRREFREAVVAAIQAPPVMLDREQVIGVLWTGDSASLMGRTSSLPSDWKYWFPAKRYGWGWGIPNSWQGWLVMAAFTGLLVLGAFLFPPGTDVGAFLLFIGIPCALLIAVCWLKGEPPRWPWGGNDRE